MTKFLHKYHEWLWCLKLLIYLKYDDISYGAYLKIYVFFSFILYYYMFSKLTPSLFVFAGLALRLRNRSSIGYESWSQVHAF